jgi:hypothetical protein
VEALLKEAFFHALRATDPYRLAQKALPPWRPDLILAVGKGAAPMLKATLDRYGEVPYHLTLPQGQDPLGLRARLARHPVPDGESQKAAEEVLSLLQSLPPRGSSRDFCGFLFHGPKRVHVQVTPESPVLRGPWPDSPGSPRRGRPQPPVRRFTSRISRSSTLVLLMCRWWPLGKSR